MSTWKIILSVALISLMTACGDTAQIKKLSDEVESLVKVKDAIESELYRANIEVGALQRRVDELEKNNNRRASVLLSPSDTAFSVLATDLGAVTVSVQNIVPYADGSKVTLRIGNPLNAEFSGEFEFGWSDTDVVIASMAFATKSKIVANPKTYAAGAWTEVNVIAEGTPPAKLKGIIVANFRTREMILRVR